MEARSPPPVFDKESKNTSEMDKLCEKLRRAYMRRDHYAQLYYKAMAQLEHTKWELAVAKKKIQELQSLSSPQPDNIVNGATSPDTTSASLYSSEETDKKPNTSPPNHSPSPHSVTPPNDISAGRANKSDYELDTKVLNQQPQKRVVFVENPPHPIVYSNNWVAAPMPPPMMQRSYSVSEGEQRSMYSSSGNGRAQRTHSLSYGRGVSQYPYPPIPPPQQINNSFSLSSDHRLPRVHRGLAYETSVPAYQPQVHQSNSAFKRVPVSIHPSDFRNQPHYSSLPSRGPRKKLLSTPEGGSWRVKSLSHSDLKLLFAEILNRKVELKKLEISSSGLGDVEAMTLLCRELKKNHMQTIEELSLPYNDISKDSLKVLLDALSKCKNIKHLKLNNNSIDQDSLEIFQTFLTKSTLKSIVLSGNEIEHHTHLLEQQLPQEFCEEPVIQEGAEGELPSHSIYSDHTNKIVGSSSLPHNIKLLQI